MGIFIALDRHQFRVFFSLLYQVTWLDMYELLLIEFWFELGEPEVSLQMQEPRSAKGQGAVNFVEVVIAIPGLNQNRYRSVAYRLSPGLV